MNYETNDTEELKRRADAGDAVPVKVNRVFDSCSDRDCISNVPVVLDAGELPANIQLVKCKCVRVQNVCMRIEPVPFNRGFYNIDLTFTFRVELLCYAHACDTPTVMEGTLYTSKSSILFGSESNTQTFYSNGCQTGTVDSCCDVVNLPTCNVQVVPPLALETKIGTICRPVQPGQTDQIPPTIRTVVMTLGLFSVIELTRPVTLLLPTYDYTIPTKECTVDTETPCAVFDKMRFPTEEFSPASLNAADPSGCGCRENG